MNDNLGPGGLNQNMQDFFADDKSETKRSTFGGHIGVAILHLIMVSYALYSAYHGIHATATYRAAEGLGAAAGIVGILTNEAFLLGLYAAYFFGRIIGDAQTKITYAAFGITFTMTLLGIVGDSQTQAGLTPPAWLRSYLTWGLPISVGVTALMAILVLATDPAVQRLIREKLKRNDFEEKKHIAHMKGQDAKLQIAQDSANVQLNTLAMINQVVNAAYRTPTVQAYIQQTAIDALPDILRGAGVMVPYGTVIEGYAIQPPAPTGDTGDDHPPPAAPTRRSLFNRLLNRDEPAQPAAVQSQTGLTAEQVLEYLNDNPDLLHQVRRVGNSTHDAPRHDAAESTTPAAGQGAPNPIPSSLAGLTPAELAQFIADLETLRQMQAATTPNGAGNNGLHPNG